MSAKKATSTDFRKSIRQSHHRQRYRWALFLAVILALLSIFSAGFFLYSAVIVTGLLILSTAVASSSLVGLQIMRTVSSREIRLGESTEAWLTVHNRKGLPASWIFWKDHIDRALDVEGAACHFMSLPSMQKHDLKYRLHSTRRGFFRVGPTVLETSGPFGLIRRFLVGESVDFLTVLPHTVAIGKGLAQGQRPVHQVPRRKSLFEDPSRFMGLRAYRPGDSMRRIHWRASARSGVLQVKLFEPTVLAGVLLAVDMGLESYPESRSKKDSIDPLLEFVITAAASLGEYVLAGDQSVGLISNGTDAAELFPEDWSGGSFRRLESAIESTHLKGTADVYQPVDVPPAKGYLQNSRLQTALARLIPSGSISLPQLLMTELPKLPRSLVLMVVTPNLNEALCRVLESLKRSGIDTGVVWCGLPEQESSVPAVIPQNVPVYRVQSDLDLEELGGLSL